MSRCSLHLCAKVPRATLAPCITLLAHGEKTLQDDTLQTEAILATDTPQANERRSARGHILFAFAILVLLGITWKLLRVLEILYVSALFAVVLMPVVQWITRWNPRGHKISRPLAIGLLLITAALLLTGFLFVGLPPVMRDLREFTHDLPQRIPEVLGRVKRIPMADKLGLDSIAQKAQDLIGSAAAYLFSSFPKWASGLFDVATAFILCIYFMLEGENAYAYFLALFRQDARHRLDRTLLIAEQRMSKWLLGQGSLMLILGVASTIVFGILHVRYFFLLGVLMGLMNIIPVVGGIITILLAGGVAALDSWPKMLGVFAFYAIYIQSENGYLTPRIMRTSVDLMGLSVLIALLVGTALAGVTGALVSVPTAALIAVLCDEYLVKKDPEAQQLAAEYKAPHSEHSPQG